MGLFKQGGPEMTLLPKQKKPQTKTINQEVLLKIPGCTVYLMDEGQALQLAKGEFTIARILDKGVPVATIIKVGDDLRWPLTKDEPVVKLDSLNYLFSLPMKDGESLSYGVTFMEQYGSSLSTLDSFLLRENSCFSGSTSTRSRNIDWKQFAPRIEDYNNVLAKAIALGTGQIVKGIFICSNIYSSQVLNIGEMILSRAAEETNSIRTHEINSNKAGGNTNKKGINQSLKRARNLSNMTESLSKATLDIVGVAAGSVMSPMVNSQAGKALIASIPGEVLLASLDAVNKVLGAAEVAEKQALSATSNATTRIVTDRFGENAGEIAEDVFATTGHCVNTTWNVIKIRKAINPASYVSTGVLKNSGKDKK